MNSSNQTTASNTTTADDPQNLIAGGETTGVPLGGNITSIMSGNDEVKFSRALDKPLGSTTEWHNGGTGYKYKVTSIKKVSVNANNLCRTYELTYSRNDQSQVKSGTACVDMRDGNWHEMS